MSTCPIITFQKIIELNQILDEKNTLSKIHLKDACGSQTMWIEALESQLSVEQIKIIKDIVSEYFESKGISIEYSKEGLSFWCK